MSTRFGSPHSATMYPWRVTSPAAAPRSLTGPTIVLYGSFPKPLAWNSTPSFGDVASDAIAICTASFTSALFIPTSSGFLCCQSKRSGKYTAVCASIGTAVAMTRSANTKRERRRGIGNLLADASIVARAHFDDSGVQVRYEVASAGRDMGAGAVHANVAAARAASRADRRHHQCVQHAFDRRPRRRESRQRGGP